MAYFPQTLSDLQGYVANLVNDPSQQRYTLTLINQQLDIAQSRWNLECKICRMTDYIALTANTYKYALTNLTLTPMKFLRVTLKGVDLVKKSKDYFDMFSSSDWTTDQGTPQEYCIDINAAGPTIIVHPTPQGSDVTSYTNSVGVSAQNPLGIEYIAAHTPMSAASDTPFMINGVQNTLILPYVAGIGLDAAASILEPDPTKETVAKAHLYRSQANSYMSIVNQVYYDLEADEPMKMHGGRNWRY